MLSGFSRSNVSQWLMAACGERRRSRPAAAAEDGGQARPVQLMRSGPDAVQVQFQVEPDVQQPGDVLGPLQVAAHPEQGIGNST